MIGLLVLSAIPTVTGVSFGISEQRKARERIKDEYRMRRFRITVYCDANSSRTKQIHGGRLILRDERLWIVSSDSEQEKQGYLGSFFYIEYPFDDGKKRDPVPLGLVSQTADNPPMLNWIYIDKDTMELKHGNRTASKDHYVGPWDWTEDEEGVTFEGEERFVAVEKPNLTGNGGGWQVYCDPDDDLLKSYIPKTWRRLQISLERVIVREEKKEEASQS